MRLIFACLAGLAPALAHASCALLGASGLGFGPYDGRRPVTAVATVSIDCAAASTLATPPGAHVMTLPTGQRLRFEVFLDPGHTERWGDGAAGTRPVSLPPGRHTVTLYGRIPPGQRVPTGRYDARLPFVLTYGTLDALPSHRLPRPPRARPRPLTRPPP